MKYELLFLPLLSMRGFWQTECQVLLYSLFSMSVLLLPMFHIHLAPGAATVGVVVMVASVQGTLPHHTQRTKKKRKFVLISVLYGLILLKYLRFVYSWLIIQQSTNNTLSMPLHSFLIGSLSWFVSCTQADMSCHGVCFGLQIAYKTP